MTQRRSPWFNAHTQPPVNGYVTDEYEQRCRASPPPHIQHNPVERACVGWLRHFSCDRCQWRGLLREPK